MNIFYLNLNPHICAKEHCDKHTIKMILEYAQLLSTAHRVLDGVEYIDGSSGRKIKRWKLNNSYDDILYKATHINHPSAVWVRKSYDNYIWLAKLLKELSKEYTHRYGKIHKCQEIGLIDVLQYAPFNVKPGVFTEPTPAMPIECIVKGDSIASYKKYYITKKQHIASWKGKINGRTIPNWYEEV
jgi:hypothetical protein